MIRFWKSGLILLYYIILSCISAQTHIDKVLNDYAKHAKITINTEYQRLITDGKRYLSEEKYQEAAEFFGRAALISPRHPQANIYLGCALFALQHYQLSGRVMRRSCSLYPNWNSLALNFNKLFVSYKKFNDKMVAFEAWLFQKSRSTDCYFLFAFLCHFSGLPSKAELAYRLILGRDPLHFEARMFLQQVSGKKLSSPYPSLQKLAKEGEQYFQQGRYRLAVSSWSTAFVCYPKNQKIGYHLSMALCAAGHLAQAATVLRLAIREAPHLLAQQIKKQSRFIKTSTPWLAQLEKFFRENSDRQDVLFLLAYIYSIIGEKRKAELALKFLKKKKWDGNIVDLMSKAFHSKG